MKRTYYVTLAAAALLVAGLSACNRDPIQSTTSPAIPSTPPSGAVTPGTPSAPVTQGAPTEPNRTMGQAVDDTAITVKVKSALIADSTVKSTGVNVDTNQGVVKLTGVVGDQAQVDRAVQIARGVEGVKSVDNNLRVGTS